MDMDTETLEAIRQRDADFVIYPTDPPAVVSLADDRRALLAMLDRLSEEAYSVRSYERGYARGAAETRSEISARVRRLVPKWNGKSKAVAVDFVAVLDAVEGPILA